VSFAAPWSLPVSADTSPSLADAYKIIASKQMVDLSHTFGVNTPVWSGFGQAIISAASDPKTHEPYTIEKHGFRSNFFSIVGQYGTHFDPPAHFAPGGISLDKVPVSQMILPLVVFDDTKYFDKDKNRALTVDDIKEWEKEHGPVPKGAFAALRHRHVQELGCQSRTFQARAVSSLEPQRRQVSVQGTRRDGHRA
jgi:kynurenine formamidase